MLRALNSENLSAEVVDGQLVVAGEREPVGDARIEPVSHPGGVDPGPPDDQQQEQRLQRAPQRQVMEQQVAELRHREHKHEIEEQLQPGRSLLLTSALAEVT